MPTYDYQCTKCTSVQEEFHGISGEHQISCKACGSLCKKIFSLGCGFILKGDNWPSKEIKLKSQMMKKNSKMKKISNDKMKSGEAVNTLADLKNKD